MSGEQWATMGAYMSKSFLADLATEGGHDGGALEDGMEADMTGIRGTAKIKQFPKPECRSWR